MFARRRWRSWAALCASLVTIAAVIAVDPPPASAATSTFTAVADTQIQETNPALNYGASTALRVDGGTDPDVQTFLRFSVGALSGTVQTAVLRVYATSGTANGPSVFVPAATWTESGLTWSNRPSLVGAGVGKVTTIAASTWAAFDVTSLVAATGTFDLVLAGTSTDGVDFQSREATNKPELVITTTTATDTAAPSVPGTLAASAPSATRIALQWGASTDDVGVSGYEIFRDNVLLTTVGAVTSFADTTVSASTAYAYQVRAFDAAGHRSGFSNTATVSTPAATAITTTFTPTADAYVSEAKPTTNYGSSRVLRVDAGTDPDVETYLRFSLANLSGAVQSATLRLNVRAATVDGPAVFLPGSSTWTETGITWNNRPLRTGSGVADAGALTTGTWATFDVTPLVTGPGVVDLVLAGASTDGVDWDSREATNRPQLVVTTDPDNVDPSPPTNVVATASAATVVGLTWRAATDDVGVTGYEIYRGSSLLATVGAVTAYTDATAKPSTSYVYTVRAKDAAGNRSVPSDPSNEVTTPADTTKPSAPTNLSATSGGTAQINLTWSAATDDVGVTNYEVYRGGSLLATVGAVTTYADTSVVSGETYSYQVKARDAAGNVSDGSNVASVATTDGQVPAAPATTSAVAAGPMRIDLSWSAASDNVGVTNYEIFRDGALLTTVGAVTTYADTTVLPGTSYSYRVRALDASGNRSAFGPSASATTPQQTSTFAPTADAKVDEATPTTNYATAALRVDYGTGSRVESDLMFAVSGTTGTVRNATLRVWATSGTIDGPAVYPTTTGWSETGITWDTRPARTGFALADVAGVSTGTWIDVDVTRLITGNGTFAMTLAGISSDGVDFTSREGTNKPQLVVTTGAADTVAPQPPGGLTATSGSPYQVDLAWNAAVDDVAVTSYVVLRGTTQLAVLDASQRTYSDTTVSPNTSYTYTVSARDAAGNTSAGSSKTVTTPTASSTAPVIAAAGDIACATSDANYNGGTGTSTACRQLYTSNLLVNGGFAAVLPLGDEQYNSGALSEFNAVYDPTWGRVKPISRPVVGNHEYGQSGASGYFTYYGSLAGDPSKGYYSFDIGSWHVVALNSNCTKVAGGCDVGSPQETWLRADLSAHPALCTLAMSHHARWSSGHDGDNVFMQAMWQDLFDAGVEVLLSGHSHDYERYARQNGSGGLDSTSGVRQFVVGTGGAFFTGFGTPDANSQVRNNDTFGILKMTLRSTGYDWQFVPEAGKTFTDSGTTPCQ